METLILLIIIGALSALFRKGNNRAAKPKPYPGKSCGELLALFKSETKANLPKLVKPVVKEVKTGPSNQTYRSENSPVQQRQSRKLLESSLALSAQPQKESRKLLLPEENPSSMLVTEEVDTESLINGIIWSEILGEPRARKPYIARRK